MENRCETCKKIINYHTRYLFST